MKEYFNSEWKHKFKKIRSIGGNMKRMKRYRNIMIELKINGCAICGYNRCIRALCFHHSNPEDKKFNLMLNNLSHSNKDIAEELNKCILLCCNCHMEIEQKE